METITFKIEEFEGPLDLLLYLISKNKMNIYDIPIMELIGQYTALIETLRENRLDVASSFIEMAARLVQMKSYLLLPRSEEAERMKAELTGELIEYSACRKVAGEMRQMAEKSCMEVRGPENIPLGPPQIVLHELGLLEDAWNSLMGKSIRGQQQVALEKIEPLVSAPVVSVSSRVVHVLRGLVTGRIDRLKQLFRREDGRSRNVATFLAVLELIRGGRIVIDDNEKMQVVRGAHRPVKENTDGTGTI